MFSKLNCQLMPVAIIDLPHLPPAVDLNDLDDRNHLIARDDYIKLVANHLPDGHICKPNSGSKFTLACQDGELHPIYKEVGKGYYGKVKLAQNEETGSWEVAKISGSKKQFQNECSMLAKTNLAIFSGKSHQLLANSHFSTKKKANIYTLLMKYVSGVTFLDLLYGKRQLPPSMWIDIAIAFVEEIIKLHKESIIHNDLHEGNIMYDYLTKEIYLIDFGNAHNKKCNADFCTDIASIQLHLNCIFALAKIKYAALVRIIANVRRATYYSDVSSHLIAPSLNDVVALLHDMKSHLSSEQKTVNIAVVDVAAAEFKVGMAQISWLLIPIQSCAEVWFIDTGVSASEKYYVELRQYLERHKIFVGDKVFKHPSAEKCASSLHDVLKERHPDLILELTNVVPPCQYDEYYSQTNINCMKL
jgi:predicted Ser/Thr protein kinase